jgi:hypothetical protein
MSVGVISQEEHAGVVERGCTRPVQEAQQIQQRDEHDQPPIKLAYNHLLFLSGVQLPSQAWA